MTKLWLKLTFWLLYSKQERFLLRASVLSVQGDDSVPVYTRDQYRGGREARRDVACHRALLVLPDMLDSRINLGVELAHQVLK